LSENLLAKVRDLSIGLGRYDDQENKHKFEKEKFLFLKQLNHFSLRYKNMFEMLFYRI
jgi:hypothetical protein